MRLYLFQCGTIRTEKFRLAAGDDQKEEIEVPVPFFLIRHERGNVLFDTGQSRASVGHASAGNYRAQMREEDYIVPQLAKVGLKPRDIDRIVLSHLHSDHAGGLEAFSDTLCYLQRKESETVAGKEIFFRKNGLRTVLLNGQAEDGFDLFGDGCIRILYTPGHTPGHQSLLVNLRETGPVLLTADSVYLSEILDRDILPGVFHSEEETRKTIARIRELRRNGVKIITGHDPAEWTLWKKAPDYYE